MKIKEKKRELNEISNMTTYLDIEIYLFNPTVFNSVYLIIWICGWHLILCVIQYNPMID